MHCVTFISSIVLFQLCVTCDRLVEGTGGWRAQKQASRCVRYLWWC